MDIIRKGQQIVSTFTTFLTKERKKEIEYVLPSMEFVVFTFLVKNEKPQKLDLQSTKRKLNFH
jgi:hypothetical protein